MDYELKHNGTTLWKGSIWRLVEGQPSVLVALGMFSHMYREANRKTLRVHEISPTNVTLGYDFYAVVPREINEGLRVPDDRERALTHVFSSSEHDADFDFHNFVCIVEGCTAASPEIDHRKL